MARYFGLVGFGEQTKSVGKVEYVVTKRNYTGDIVRATIQSQAGEKVVNDISVSNSISILADDYAVENFSKIIFVMWHGVAWTVTSVEFSLPRLILSLGEVYNGPTE